MARLDWITCRACGKHKQVVCSSSDPYPHTCGECISEATDRKEREWKASREGLTIEERIRDLEYFMYHHGEHYKGPVVFG